MKQKKRAVGAIDLGTTGTRFVLFDEGGREIGAAYRELPLSYPRPGWVEQDPEVLVQATLEVMREALAAAPEVKLLAIGITNQRETTVVWERATGRPLHAAIVWQDRRTAARCEELARGPVADLVRERTGLTLDPYFSATKLEWLLREVPGLASRARKGEVAFGTVDSWLLSNLCGVHATDTTNASRTLLFDIHRLAWDDELLSVFSIPSPVLPEVRPSISELGRVKPGLPAAGVPVTGVLGDQQAALFGQAGIEPGAAKVTWGTGAFLLANTGPEPVPSRKGLLTTVAYSLAGGVHYALEGAAFAAGAAVQWLRDLGLISRASETEPLAAGLADNEGVYFVPALAGLGAPYWDPFARGLLIGLTRGTSRAHLARAALEAIAYQTWDLASALVEDFGELAELRVDGGAARNDFLCQFQADIAGLAVVRPRVLETTSLGAALAAGVGAGLWELEDIPRLVEVARRFTPQMEPGRRRALIDGWQRAVARARGWAKEVAR